MSPKYLLENWKLLLWSIVFTALGVLSLMYPDALADVEATGRRAFFKQLLIWLWGWPVGIGGLLLGGLGFLGSLSPNEEDDE